MAHRCDAAHLSAPTRRRHRAYRAALAGAIVLSASAGGAANAQQIVYDPTAYGKLIEQAQTALKELDRLQAQVDQAKRLYDGFNQASGVNRIAEALAAPQLRAVLPDADRFIAAAHGDLASLGAIGAKAAAIRQAARKFTPAADDPAGQALDQAGDRAARDLALGETVADAGAQRLQGLQDLQAALTTAPNARAVIDLQARLGAEQAMIANDQMRLQGLAMAQAAEQRLAAQQARETAAAARRARMQMYEEAFR